MSTGKTFDGLFAKVTECGTSGYCDAIQFVDLNADGKSDLVYRDPSGINTWLSNGREFINKVTVAVCQSGSADCKSTSNYSTIRTTDVNGDGMADMVYRSESGINTRVWPGNQSNLITRVTNGLGAVNAISYAPLTSPAVYAKNAGTAAYPMSETLPPLWVVAYDETTRPNFSTMYRKDYFYVGARVGRNGRGFLGFSSFRVFDPQTEIRAVYEYRQDFPFTGLLAGTAQEHRINSTGNGTWTTVSTSSNTYGSVSPGAGRYLPYVSGARELVYELDMAGVQVADTMTTTTVDSYGNPTAVTVTSPNLDPYGTGVGTYTKSTVNTYSNDTANWLIGKLTRSEVTNTLPDSSSQKRVTAYGYDAKGQLIKETIEPDLPTLRLTKDYAYNALGNLISTTVSGGDFQMRSSSTTYDVNGHFPASKTNEKGHVETYVYDMHFGTLLSLKGPNGLTTAYTYDVFGRKTKEQRADGTQTTWSYNNCDPYLCSSAGGEPRTFVVIQESGSPTKKVYYDVLNREVQSEIQGFDGRSVYVDTSYDPAGRVFTVSRPYYSGNQRIDTRYAYDALSRVTNEIYPGGTYTDTRTSYGGLRTMVTNPRQFTTTQVKNVLGQVVEVIDALNGSTKFSYDHFGNLIKVVDAKGNTTTATFDIRSRKTAMVDPDMGAWSYQYNALGEMTKQTDAKGQVTTFKYDLLGRMTQRDELGMSSYWYYDSPPGGIGKLVVAGTSTSSVGTHYHYDTLGRLIETARVDNGTMTVLSSISTTYDSFGRREKVTYPSGFAVQNVYNAYGYLSEVRNAANVADYYWRADALAADGQVLRERIGAARTDRTYDPDTALIKSISTLQGSFNNIQYMTYSYDAVGNLTQRADGITETFTYDALNRVTGVGSSTGTRVYAYDSIGNITSKSDVGAYSYGAKPHAVTSTTGTVNSAYTYDTNGNMLTGNGRTLTYNAFNKPASVTLGGATTGYTYDENHDRVRKTTSTSTTDYFGKLYEETTFTNGALEKRHHIHAGDRLVAIYVDRGASKQTQYIYLDALGSIHTVADGNGAVLARYSYDAFGKRRNPDGTELAAWPSTAPGTRGYTGHEMDDDARCVNMNARLYDPVIGRFLQADPLVARPGSTQGMNRYSYTDNNPLTRTDPSGYNWLSDRWKAAWDNRVQIAVVAIAIYTGYWASSAYSASIGAAAASSAGGTAVAAGVQAMTAGAVVGAYGGYRQSGDFYGTLGGAIVGASIGGVTAGATSGIEASSMTSAGKILANSTVGGVQSAVQGGSFQSGFKTSFGVETLSAAALWMRKKTLESSNKYWANSSGDSVGFRGDGYKAGGGRYDYAAAERGEWDVSMPRKTGSPLGGWQGGQGKFFMIPYSKGDVLDYVVEAYAGPHDWLNSGYWYDAAGNIDYRVATSKFRSAVGEVINAVNVIPATLFVGASVIQPYRGTAMLMGWE